MALKNEILEILERNRGRSVSGRDMAAKLGVTRAAVWKAIGSLRADGHGVEAVPNRGYMLCRGSDVLTAEAIRSALDYDGEVTVYDEIGSTLAAAGVAAAGGAADGTIIVAARQTAGRGRRGRSFFAPDGGAYFTVILRPKISAADSVYLTTAAAVATAEAIEELTGRRTGIKWLNDITIDGKKCVGILCEATFGTESGELESVSVGIGINVGEEHFPPELADIACSVGNVRRSALIAAVANKLVAISRRLPECDHLERYRSRCFVIGRDITVHTKEGSYPAVAIGLNERAGLIVRDEAGEEHTLSSDEVSVRIKE